MLWALAQHDPEHWLPADAAVQADAMQLVAQCDGDFKHHLDRYKYPNRYDLPDGLTHRAQGAAWLATLEARIASQGFLLDRQWRWTDAAIAPFVRQFARTDAPWFAAQPWPALQAWLAALEASPAFGRVMKSYKPWQLGQAQVLFPSAD
jgi:glutathione S-transferase